MTKKKELRRKQQELIEDIEKNSFKDYNSISIDKKRKMILVKINKLKDRLKFYNEFALNTDGISMWIVAFVEE